MGDHLMGAQFIDSCVPVCPGGLRSKMEEEKQEAPITF